MGKKKLSKKNKEYQCFITVFIVSDERLASYTDGKTALCLGSIDGDKTSFAAVNAH